MKPEKDPLPPPSIEPSYRFNPYKQLFWGLLVLSGLAALIGGAYLVGREQTRKLSLTQTSARVLTPSPVLTTIFPSPSVQPVLEQNIVYYTNTGEKILLKYQDLIFDNSDQLAMQPLTEIDPLELYWIPIIEAPYLQKDLIWNEVFGLMPYSNNQKFLFLMRWGVQDPKTEQIKEQYFLYSYDIASIQWNIVHIFNKTTRPDQDYEVPKLDQLNSNGTLLALKMFECWNCEGHAPETLIMDLSTKQEKSIGRTSEFAWLEDGKYEYKEYISKPCENPETPIECFEDPSELPLKVGQF